MQPQNEAQPAGAPNHKRLPPWQRANGCAPKTFPSLGAGQGGVAGIG